jgi:uncharacterized protein YbbC (DUF1343 family)
MHFGIDVLLKNENPDSVGRIALVTNDVAVTSSAIPSRKALIDRGFRLNRLFSPEHGLSAAGADGLRQDDHVDPVTGLPVISLYGDKMAPNHSDLEGIDAVYFDIPDIGCRFYTYLWTMTYVMESCAEARIPFTVLDRPNPTGADLSLAEGPWLDEQHCTSFIGRWNIPIRHCCTLGELAGYFKALRIPKLSLQVIPVPSYDRKSHSKKDLPFIPTSPAIQNLQSARCYPGTCLAEGLNLNEGRGTEYSFRVYAAPWLEVNDLIIEIEKNPLAGITFEACRFKAVFPPYKGEWCPGICWAVTDPETFHPVQTGWQLLRLIRLLHPDRLRPRPYPTAANPSGKNHLDLLLGIENAVYLLLNDSEPNTAIDSDWQKEIGPFLLY